MATRHSELAVQLFWWANIAVLLGPIFLMAYWNDKHPTQWWPVVACFGWLFGYIGLYIWLIVRKARISK